MKQRQYNYVGPSAFAEAIGMKTSDVIQSLDELSAWSEAHQTDADQHGNITATFVIDLDGMLRLAPRRTEHVACAGGKPVLSAGEITFNGNGNVSEISNQSTGYCPEPESWPAVAVTLKKIGVAHLGGFTTEIVFRRCTNCAALNLVKDSWLCCELCGGELPQVWNVDTASAGSSEGFADHDS